MSEPTGDEFASAEDTGEEVTDPIVLPEADGGPRPDGFTVTINGLLLSDADNIALDREDELAADLREFLKGRGVDSAVMVNSAGESIDLTGEPQRPGV